MRPIVAISPWNIATYAQGGGHFWVPTQYALGLQQLGCEVWWVEEYRGDDADEEQRRHAVELLRERLHELGLGDRCIVWSRSDDHLLTGTRAELERLENDADLLLNFNYALTAEFLDRFSTTALVDIDPGLFQYWASTGQIQVAPHDHYVTTGETVGRAGSPIPSLGVEWLHIRPPIALDQWPQRSPVVAPTYTTVSGWWSGEWIEGDDGQWFDNNKRAAFLPYLELAERVDATLELALNLAAPRPDGLPTCDDEERARLEAKGWRVRHAFDVAADPFAYRRYIAESAGEFSCAKPSCLFFENAWVSDRTVCYLGSGRPAVVEYTGESELLPDAEGIFRFRNIDEATAAFAELDRNYEKHAAAARRLAEQQFSAELVLGDLMARILS